MERNVGFDNQMKFGSTSELTGLQTPNLVATLMSGAGETYPSSAQSWGQQHQRQTYSHHSREGPHSPPPGVVLRQPVLVERPLPDHLQEEDHQHLSVGGLPVPGVLANTLRLANTHQAQSGYEVTENRDEEILEEVNRLREENNYLKTLIQSFLTNGGSGRMEPSASAAFPQFETPPRLLPLRSTTPAPPPSDPVVLRFKGSKDNRFIIPIFSPGQGESPGEYHYRDYPREKEKRKATGYPDTKIFDDYSRDSWRKRLSRILSRSRRSSETRLILKRPSVLRNEIPSQEKLSVVRDVSKSQFYQVPGEANPVTVFTEEESPLTVVSAPPANATNTFYETDISLDPLDVILQLQMQVFYNLTKHS